MQIVANILKPDSDGQAALRRVAASVSRLGRGLAKLDHLWSRSLDIAGPKLRKFAPLPVGCGVGASLLVAGHEVLRDGGGLTAPLMCAATAMVVCLTSLFLAIDGPDEEPGMP